MRRFIIGLLLFMSGFLSQAQQQSLVTQYFNQVITFNPAFAGNHKHAELSMSYRSQWLGLEGAPTSQFLNYHMAVLDRRVGWGLGIERTSQGISQEMTGNFYYSYRIKLKPGVLSIGVQASAKNYFSDYSDPRIVTTQPRAQDSSIPTGKVNKTVPNFGFGAYFKADNYFIGISSPRLLNNNIDYTNDAQLSREQFHAYILAGLKIPLGNDISIQPMMLSKVVKNSPIDFDWTLFFRFVDRLGFGMNYRARNSILEFKGESFSFIFNATVSKNLVMGVSYDMTLSELRDYSGGSAEFYMQYGFEHKKDKPKQ